MLHLIKRRRSVRAYRPDPIDTDTLRAIVEAGTYAPSGTGEAWHFTVIRNAEMLARINRLAKAAATQSGLPWLEQLGQDENFHCLYGSPVLVYVSCDTANPAAESDAAAATQNILLAAESLGLGACWGYFATMALQTPEGGALRETLKIPAGYEVFTSVMIGHKQDDTPIPAPARKPGTITFIE